MLPASTLIPALLLAAMGWHPALPGWHPSSAHSSWDWPVPDPHVLAEFDAPSVQWGRGHRGIDLAAATGDPVRAIGAGVVAFVGSIAGKPVVAIDHPGTGLRSTYEPVTSSLRIGQAVAIGDVIGEVVAHGGHCGGRCLHLGLKHPASILLKQPERYVDPGPLLRHWAVLKPIRSRHLPPGRLPAGAPG